MDLHKIQNKKDFVFTKPTIIEQDLSNMANSNLTPISIKKKKGGKKEKEKIKKKPLFLGWVRQKIKINRYGMQMSKPLLSKTSFARKSYVFVES